MNYSLLVAILHSGYYLPEFSPRLFLFHPSMQDQIIENFAARSILHHEIQSLLCLNNLKELDNVWMIKHLHYPNFPEKFLKRTRIQLGLIYDLDGHFFSGRHVLCKFHFRKVAFPYGLEEFVLAYGWFFADPCSATGHPGRF